MSFSVNIADDAFLPSTTGQYAIFVCAIGPDQPISLSTALRATQGIFTECRTARINVEPSIFGGSLPRSGRF